MTVSVNIGPEVEARLVARARSTGQSLEGFIQRVLEREAEVPETNRCPELSGAEKAQAFRVWAKDFPDTLPVLSLESVSRENIYRRD